METLKLTSEQMATIAEGKIVFHETFTIEQFKQRNSIRPNAKGQTIGKYGQPGKMFLGYLIPGSERPQFLAGKVEGRIERPVVSLVTAHKTDKEGTKLYNEDRTPVLESKYMIHTEAKALELAEEAGY